jgi:hypothetical protein
MKNIMTVTNLRTPHAVLSDVLCLCARVTPLSARNEALLSYCRVYVIEK